MKKFIPLWAKVLPLYFVVALVLYIPVKAQSDRKDVLIHDASLIDQRLKPAVYQNTNQSPPIRIVIPAVSTDLTVVDGRYDNQKGWQVAANAANFATISKAPNHSGGKTVIYGHDTPHVLKPIQNIAKGDRVYVYTESGHIFSYRYAGDAVVSPNNTTVFSELENGPPQLVVITCAGVFSEVRRILYFDFIGVAR